MQCICGKMFIHWDELAKTKKTKKKNMQHSEIHFHYLHSECSQTDIQEFLHKLWRGCCRTCAKTMTLTHTSSVGHWADSGLGFAEPRLSFCSGQTPEVASLPLYWRLHLHSNTETGRTVSKRTFFSTATSFPTKTQRTFCPTRAAAIFSSLWH